VGATSRSKPTHLTILNLWFCTGATSRLPNNRHRLINRVILTNQEFAIGNYVKDISMKCL